MAYSRWSTSNWFVFGTLVGLVIMHACGVSFFMPDSDFDTNEPPTRIGRLPFDFLEDIELQELDVYIGEYWKDMRTEKGNENEQRQI